MTRDPAVSQAETKILSQEVQMAVHAFAQALAESGEFLAFEQAAERFNQDEIAQQAIRVFQDKQHSLQMLIRLNAVSPEDRADLERLQKAFLDRLSVIDYLDAQENLKILCQAAADLLSSRIGLSYATVCGPGCC